jgi:tetratricopeptide (TPR) repeat protein
LIPPGKISLWTTIFLALLVPWQTAGAMAPAVYDLQRGVQAYSGYQYARSLDFLNHAVTSLPAEPLALLARAQVLLKLSRPNEAVADLRKALQLSKYKGAAHSRLGLCYLQLRQPELAEKELEQSLQCNELDPLRWAPWIDYLNLAEVKRSLGKVQAAQDLKLLGMKLKADSLARDRREALDLPGALKAADAVVVAKPDLTYSHYLRGVIRLNAGLAVKSAEDFSFVIAHQKDVPAPYYFRADALSDCGRVLDAIKDYSRVIELSPNVVAIVDVAETGRCKTAGRTYDEGAVTLADIYYLRAAAYRRLRQFEAAKADIERSLKLNPGDIDVKLLAVDLLLGEDKSKEALAALEKILKDNPKSIQCLQLLVAVYAKMKLFDKALATANVIVQNTGGDTTALLSRAKVFRQMGRWQESIDDYSRALDNDDVNNEFFREEAFSGRAAAYAQMGEWQHVLDDCNKALKFSVTAPTDLQKLKERAQQKLSLRGK